MRANGCPGATTIHRLIYFPYEDEDGELRFALKEEESEAWDASLIVLDECSMVNEEVAKDLLSFERPILVMGDPAQLPRSRAGVRSQAKSPTRC
jgi:exodeoxyribonuclease V